MLPSRTLVDKVISGASRIIKGEAGIAEMFAKGAEYVEKESRNKIRVIEGQILWPHDPFYRPVVGLYVDERLVSVAATTRTTADQTGGWPCAYKISYEANLSAPQSVRVVCMETGVVLFTDNAVPASNSGNLSVEALLRLGDAKKTDKDLTGFLSLLRMPVTDQVDFLFTILLGRGSEPPAVAEFSSRILNKELTLLDLRDLILQSDEFLTNRLPRVSSHFCYMLVWGGLNDFGRQCALTANHAADDRIGYMPLSAVTKGGLQSVAETADLSQYLAKLSLGSNASATQISVWLQQHRKDVDLVLQEVAAFKKTHDLVRPFKRSSALYVRGILSSMQVGPAGLRAKEMVRSKAGAPGVAMFGPYLSIVSGRYGLDFSLRTSGRESGVGRVWVEIVYDTIIFASMSVIPEDERASYTFDFCVPKGADKLQQSKFEFRFWTDGKADVEFFDLTLKHYPDEADGAGNLDINLLPLVTAGQAGKLAGDSIKARKAAKGFVFYGPYRSLLPGHYILSLELDYEGPAPDDGELVLEVLGAEAQRLASITQKTSGTSQRLDLPVTIRSEGNAQSIPPSLEFRLFKSSGFDFTVTALFIKA